MNYFKSLNFTRWFIILLYFRTSVIRPPIGIQTDRRIRVFLFDLSIMLFEYNVLVSTMDKNIIMKFRTNTEMKYDIEND